MRARLSLLLSAAVLGMVLAPAAAHAQPPVSAPAPSDLLPGLAVCEYTPTPENPPARPVTPPFPLATDHGAVHATIETNHGDLAVELDRRNAPCAVHNLVHLARQHFYQESQCWRLTNSARLGVLQCGDIFAAEKGGPGYRFDDEVTGAETYPRGTIAMGNQGPNTNGSQFFIVHSHANIPPDYTVLGRVVAGMDVLDRIVAGGIVPGPDDEQDGLPATPVHIGRIDITG